MGSRQLFLVGYDIRHARRRHHVLRDVKGHALGGQKSFYECWLSSAELQDLMRALAQCIDPQEDKVLFVQLDSRTESICLGQAESIDKGDFFHIG